MEAIGAPISSGPEQTAAQTPEFGPQMPLPEKLLAIAIRAQNFTGASGVAVAIKEGDEVVCRASWGTSAPDVGVRLRDRNSFTYQCLLAGVAMRCDDASSDPRVDSVACANLGIASIAAAPVGHGDGVLGVIAAFSEEPNAFTETHMVVLTTLGEVVAKFLKDEVPVPSGAAADEPLALDVDSTPPLEVEPLQEIAPDLAPVPAATFATPKPDAGEHHVQAPSAVPEVPVLTSILAAARSKSPTGVVEKQPEIAPGGPAFEVPPVPGLVASAEQISPPQKMPGETPSAKPPVVPAQKPARVPVPHFGMASSVDWRSLLHRKFVIPVGAAAVLVFALVTWTFHSFRGRHTAPTPPVSVEQPADSSPAQAPEPAELTAAVPTSNTVMDVSVKAVTEKPSAPVQKQKLEAPPQKSAVPAPVIEKEGVVRKPNATNSQAKPDVAAPPSLALLELPEQLPALKMALPASNVVGPSVSHLVPSKLLHSSPPVYPDAAKRLHMGGSVVLSAKIGADGRVKSITVVSGPAVLHSSAVSAVKNWRYRPATLDGQAVESTAEITLNFAAPR